MLLRNTHKNIIRARVQHHQLSTPATCHRQPKKPHIKRQRKKRMEKKGGKKGWKKGWKKRMEKKRREKEKERAKAFFSFLKKDKKGEQ